MGQRPIRARELRPLDPALAKRASFSRQATLSLEIPRRRGFSPTSERLLAEAKPERQPRKAGSAKGMLTILTEDHEHQEAKGAVCVTRENTSDLDRFGDDGVGYSDEYDS